MARRAPRQDVGDADLEVDERRTTAAGVPAVARALQMSVGQMGTVRSARTLLRLNQDKGFDCPGCAWPDPAPGARHVAEFCENGAKAVAEEATLRRVEPDFFVEHSIDSLRGRSDHWLGQQGRLTTPMHKPEGAAHYEPVTWERALEIVARHLCEPRQPRRGDLLHVRAYEQRGRVRLPGVCSCVRLGTNNLPDCSNMCHESSGTALLETIGIGKGTVSLDDLTCANLILIAGQNPGTNHPRMLSTLEQAKAGGARIVSINPLPEAGLKTFHNPQTVRGVVGSGTPLADRHLGVRLGGDQALFQAVGHLLLERGAVDEAFVAEHTTGFEAYAAARAFVDWPATLAATGLTEDEIRGLADDVASASRVVVCWAMGITQHRHAVATIQDMLNVLLLGGHIGREGAGVCPVRGHSNVQGDRTMGIFERPAPGFLDALDAEFGIRAPREHGVDAVDTVRALRDGRAKVFFAMGGNFVRAMSDSDVTESALERAEPHLSRVDQASTGRTPSPVERRSSCRRWGAPSATTRLTGEQVVTVEDSMAMVHASRGRLAPASDTLLSEVAIVCEPRAPHPARVPGRLVRAARRLPPNPVAHLAGRAGVRPLRGAHRRARRLPPADPSPAARVPGRRRSGPVHRARDGVPRVSPGAPAPADHPQPRPVQHHDLRARRPLPRGQGRATGRVRQPGGPRRASASPTGAWSTSCPSGAGSMVMRC